MRAIGTANGWPRSEDVGVELPPHSGEPGAAMRTIQIYDTTLRDGTQGEGVSLSLVDKLQITERLDQMGFDYIEGGYPLSNEKDIEYFRRVRELDLKHAKVCAFGMTRRRGVEPNEDPGMQALIDSGAPVCTIVGKTSDFHATQVLRVSLEENLAMISDSVQLSGRLWPRGALRCGAFL